MYIVCTPIQGRWIMSCSLRRFFLRIIEEFFGQELYYSDADADADADSK